jgi:mannose/fructose/N-acetylgalactosamine-specific phosphotransferase system component IIC
VIALAVIAVRFAVLSFLINNKTIAAKNGTNKMDNNIIVA